MQSVAKLPRLEPSKQNRLVFSALVISVMLHGLVLSISLGSHATTSSLPHEELAPRLTISLKSFGVFGDLSPESNDQDRQIQNMTPQPTRAQRNRVSRLTNPRHSSNHDFDAEKSDTPESRHYSSTSPSIDIDAAREIARKFGRESAGPSSQHASPDTLAAGHETALGTSFAKAARPDCRNAQSNKTEIGGGFTFTGQGLLAIPSLIVGAVTDSGCKW